MSLSDYIKKLSTDATARDTFIANPSAAMSDSGLSDEEKLALLSGNSKKIRAALGDNKTAGISITITINL